jgi:hypothetical protein
MIGIGVVIIMCIGKNNVLILKILILLAIIIVPSCGPFYTTMYTRYLTREDKSCRNVFRGYEIELHIGARELGNRKGSDKFGFLVFIKSVHKYSTEPLLDTVDVIKVEPLCIHFYEGQGDTCLAYYIDSTYVLFWEEKRISHEPGWGGYGPFVIPKEHDSILISYVATLYDDTTYSVILDRKEFRQTLYRKYKKLWPINR